LVKKCVCIGISSNELWNDSNRRFNTFLNVDRQCIVGISKFELYVPGYIFTQFKKYILNIIQNKVFQYLRLLAS